MLFGEIQRLIKTEFLNPTIGFPDSNEPRPSTRKSFRLLMGPHDQPIVTLVDDAKRLLFGALALTMQSLQDQCGKSLSGRSVVKERASQRAKKSDITTFYIVIHTSLPFAQDDTRAVKVRG